MNDEQTPGEAMQLIELLHRIEPLKHLPRTGWVDRGVHEPESVASHSWRLALLAWISAEAQGLDAENSMRLALVHDLPEAITGDLTPFDDPVLTGEARRALATEPPDVSAWPDAARRLLKVEEERRALATILATAPPAAARALSAAWEEYEEGASPEARLVRQLDKLEAYVQGQEYARDGKLSQETLNSFRVDNERQLHDPALRALLAALERWARHPGAPAQHDDLSSRSQQASQPPEPAP